jgi:PAS domain-containing protein
MDRVFMVWLEIFSNKKFLSKSNNYRIAYYVGKHLIVYLQHIQFFWYYDMKIAYFSAYEIFWKTLSLASFDVIAASYGFLRNYALFITIFLSGSLSLIVASIFASIFKKKFPAKVYPFLRFLIIVTCDVMFIPTALVLQLAFKYSEPGKSRITEYSTFVPASEMDFGEGSRFGFMIVLIIFLGFSWMFEASSYEMRHSIEDEIHDNKIFCLVDFMKKIVDFLTTVLFLNFGSENYEMYLIILLVLHMVTSAAYVVCIPYYCYFMNYLKIISSVSLALHSLFFLVGLKIDNSSVTLILCISSPLLLVPLCKAGLDRRYQMIEKPQVSIFHKFETFEKSIRGYLKNGQLSERLIRKLNKNNNFNKSVLNKLTQAYYCNDVIGNCALALNKVFQTKKKALNFLLNFQVFKCQHIMLTACENLSQSFKLYKYFLEFAKIKKGDKKFCEHYNKLLMKLIEKNPNITEIKKVIVGVVGHLYRLEKRYTSLLMRFPNANEIKQSYGTFMINILNDITRGGKLVTRMSNTRIQRNLTRNMLRFIVDRCFLVISGNYSTLGKILFHNQNFLNFLGYTNETIKHISLNQLIPKEFIRHHDKHMLNFLENSTSNTVFKNAVLSLVNSEGYLCECIINCECIGYDKSVNFICAIDPLNFRRREMALVSLDGFIFGHSKGLCSLLGAGRRSVEGRFIQEFVDSFEMEALQNSQMKYFQIFDTCDRFNLPREVAFLLKITKVRKTGVLLLYVSEDKNEIKSWENDQEFYDVDELNNYGNKIETVITEGFDEFKESVVKKKVKIFDQDSENDDNEEKKLIESQLKNSTSRTGQHYQYLSENDFKAISKSKTVLRVTKIIMIVSVSSM